MHSLVWTSGGVDDIFGINNSNSTSTSPPTLSLTLSPSLKLSTSTMSLVNITSKEQFSSLLGAAVFVVADCKSFFPAVYALLLACYPSI